MTDDMIWRAASRTGFRATHGAAERLRSSSDDSSRIYSEEDLRDAFRAGWHERNRNPGLKKQPRRNLDNMLRIAIGARDLDYEYVPDRRSYHASLWAKSQFRRERVSDDPSRGRKA